MNKHSAVKSDIFLILGIAVFGIILALIIVFTQHKGKMVQVSVDGVVVETLPLSFDAVYEICGADGGINTLCIKDGTASVTAATCPDGLCINMGQIIRSGQSIICLPNKVVVEILGDDEASEVDAVAR